jgi:4-hydroxybenzoate polyprenyltransferase
MTDQALTVRPPVARRVLALITTSHPGPSLAIATMAALLAAQAAPHGTRPLAAAVPMLAGQLSIGWSNDAFDAGRDAAAGRTDKPLVTGGISPRAVWTAALVSLVASLAMSLALGVVVLLILLVIVGAGWAYNAGLKSTAASGLMYLAGFGTIPAYSVSTAAQGLVPTWGATSVAALLGLGTHFANVLPDLDADRTTGVRGLPQQLAARWGTRAVRAVALMLLLSASVLVVLGARPERRWFAIAGLGVCTVVAALGARGSGKVPFVAAIVIAAIDAVLFAAGVDALDQRL